MFHKEKGKLELEPVEEDQLREGKKAQFGLGKSSTNQLDAFTIPQTLVPIYILKPEDTGVYNNFICLNQII